MTKDAAGVSPAGSAPGDAHDSTTALDSIPGLVGLLTAGGEIQFVNRRVLEYTGRTQEELRNWATSDIVHAEDLPQVIQVFSQSISSGSFVRD